MLRLFANIFWCLKFLGFRKRFGSWWFDSLSNLFPRIIKKNQTFRSHHASLLLESFATILLHVFTKQAFPAIWNLACITFKTPFRLPQLFNRHKSFLGLIMQACFLNP